MNTVQIRTVQENLCDLHVDYDFSVLRIITLSAPSNNIMVPANKVQRIVKWALLAQLKCFSGKLIHVLKNRKEQFHSERDLKHLIRKNKAFETLCCNCSVEDHLHSDTLCQPSSSKPKKHRKSGNDAQNKSGNLDDGPLFPKRLQEALRQTSLISIPEAKSRMFPSWPNFT